MERKIGSQGGEAKGRLVAFRCFVRNRRDSRGMTGTRVLLLVESAATHLRRGYTHHADRRREGKGEDGVDLERGSEADMK